MKLNSKVLQRTGLSDFGFFDESVFAGEEPGSVLCDEQISEVGVGSVCAVVLVEDLVDAFVVG